VDADVQAAHQPAGNETGTETRSVVLRSQYRSSATRRQVLQMGAAALTSGLALPSDSLARAQSRRPKKVVVAGGGIAGLSCAYELMGRGHEVTLLEAAGRPGGHVRTTHDLLADGLYADVGAEHFYKPIYRIYWKYLDEFKLPIVPYPRRDNLLQFINGKPFTPHDLQTERVLNSLRFNAREIKFLKENPWWSLPLLYFQPYLGKFKDENQPFGIGLDELDRLSVSDLLRKDGASAAAMRFAGGGSSALEGLWNAAIKQLRGAPLVSHDLYRIKGGNQRLTDAFAAKLGERIHLGTPVTEIAHSESGVKVKYKEFGETKTMEADYLVCCMSAVMLRRLPVTPAFPAAKAFAIHNMPYYTEARVIFQSRTPFWERDGVSPNMEFGSPELRATWRIADEVETSRAVLIGTAPASSSAEEALAAFRRLYPGKSDDIEQVQFLNWAHDPWAMACERVGYAPGDLAKFWPHAAEPCGRIYFAGAYAANISMGQEAALESANRAADMIDQA
jgi:monoamine oxidase